MLIYSAKFQVKKEFTKDVFTNLVISWNQGSPHDKMEGLYIEKNKYELKHYVDNRSIEIQDLPEKNTIASRFRKEDENGVIWTTDFVLDYNDNILSIRLDRETTNETTNFILKFSPPHFVKMVISNKYADVDNDISISNSPLSINLSNKDIIKKVILKKGKYNLPIVYITKTWAGNYPLDINKLAITLQGVAHVLKESDPAVSKYLMTECESKNAHHGGIAIYYPSISARDKIIRYRPENSQELLIKKIINNIFRYSNQQTKENIYTWEEVQIEKLRLKNRELLDNHALIENENRDLYDTFGQQFEEYEDNIELLNNRISALMQENQGLRMKIDNMEQIPLLFYGEEDELYEGEIRDLIWEILQNSLNQYQPNTRRVHIINDLLENNENRSSIQEKRDHVKKILRGYTYLTTSMRKGLEEIGFEICEDGKHYKLTYYGDSRYIATMAKTCSDFRAGDNLASEISKIMM